LTRGSDFSRSIRRPSEGFLGEGQILSPGSSKVVTRYFARFARAEGPARSERKIAPGFCCTGSPVFGSTEAPKRKFVTLPRAWCFAATCCCCGVGADCCCGADCCGAGGGVVGSWARRVASGVLPTTSGCVCGWPDNIWANYRDGSSSIASINNDEGG
jgi:hypothetical protein